MMRVNVLITFDFRSSQSHNVAERRHRLLIIGRREKNINQAALHVTLLPSSLKGTLFRIVTELHSRDGDISLFHKYEKKKLVNYMAILSL